MSRNIQVAYFPSATVLSHEGNGRRAVVTRTSVIMYASSDDYVAQRPARTAKHTSYVNGLAMGRAYLSETAEG